MALLGIISLIQLLFLPGYLILYRVSFIKCLDKILLAPPISAVVNFFMVFFLVSIESYTQTMIVSVFIFEVLILFIIKLKIKKENECPGIFFESPIVFNINYSNIAFGLLTLFCFAQFINQVGTVFTQGDAVMSWNHWAISWFRGKIPDGLAWYPQLLPTLYSLTYTFIGDSRIELFSKIAVSSYPLIAIAVFLRMAVLLPSERDKILWSAVIFFCLVRRLWGSENTINGYADFPLAFFCICILYVFVLKKLEIQEKRSTESLIFPAILVCISLGAGLTKQSGVYLGFIAPLIWFALFHDRSTLPQQFKILLKVIISIALGYASWYLYQYSRISAGIDSSNLTLLANIVDLPWHESLFYGLTKLTKKLSLLWIILFIASLNHRYLRNISLIITIPFILLWAAFVPYDYRNLAAIFPLLAISLAYGWVELIRILNNFPIFSNFNKIFNQKSVFIAALFGLSIVFANPKYNYELLQLSNSAKKQIGHPEINNLLIAYFEFNPAPSLIATPYAELSKIPMISERYEPFSCRFDNENQRTKLLLDSIMSASSKLEVGYILMMPWCDTFVQEYFLNRPEQYLKIFHAKGANFYKILNSQSAKR